MSYPWKQMVTYIQTMGLEVCGISFQRLEVSADPRVVVHCANIPLGKTEFTFTLP
jgi:hypothetical protein